MGEDNAEKIREEREHLTVGVESPSQGISNFENEYNSPDDDKGGTSVGEILKYCTPDLKPSEENK